MGVKERKEREKEFRREEILKTGEKLFIDKGFANTTMDELARECELAKGTIYLYFKSKEELLSGILYRVFTELYELMFSYQNGITNPIERLKRIGDAYFEFHEKYPEHFRLLNDLHMTGKFYPETSYQTHSQLRERIKKIWELNMAIVQNGMDAGIFKASTDPLEVAISLWAISTTMINMHDFKKSMKENNSYNHPSVPFLDLDFLDIISINAKRIIFSILKNPPADFNLLL